MKEQAISCRAAGIRRARGWTRAAPMVSRRTCTACPGRRSRRNSIWRPAPSETMAGTQAVHGGEKIFLRSSTTATAFWNNLAFYSDRNRRAPSIPFLCRQRYWRLSMSEDLRRTNRLIRPGANPRNAPETTTRPHDVAPRRPGAARILSGPWKSSRILSAGFRL